MEERDPQALRGWEEERKEVGEILEWAQSQDTSRQTAHQWVASASLSIFRETAGLFRKLFHSLSSRNLPLKRGLAFGMHHYFWANIHESESH